MTEYYGDFPEDATVYLYFNTFSSDDPSASVTITNLVDADIHVHKNGGTTQIATDGATIAIDFDSITGNHIATIDTSAHADYSTGAEYAARIEGTTVDGATINAWIGAWSIERTGGPLALLTGTNSLSDIESKIDTLDTVADGIQTDLSNGTDGLGALKTLIDTANTDLSNGTDGLGALKALIDTVDTVADSILSMLDDARAEPGQGTPPVNPDLATKIDYLYKIWRNKMTNDGTDNKFFADDGSTVDHKQTTSESGGTVTVGEMAAGP